MEQTHEPMYKNRMRGIRCRTSGQRIVKSISIKGTGCKSGGCVRKAVEITSGDLLVVLESRLRMEQSILTGRQKSAEGVVSGVGIRGETLVRKGEHQPVFLESVTTGKARTVLERG